MAVDMQKLLGKKVEDAKREPKLPKGLWKLLCLGSKQTKSSKKGTDGVEFSFKVLEAGNDVDVNELGLWRDDMKSLEANPDDVKRSHTFYLTEKSFTLVMLREFIERCGVAITGRSFEECIPECQGRQVWGSVVHEPIEGRVGEFQERFGGFYEVK